MLLLVQGRYGVYYDDGDVEALDLGAETWRLAGEGMRAPEGEGGGGGERVAGGGQQQKAVVQVG